MRAPQICFKLSPAAYEEILILCKERRKTVSAVVRDIVVEALIATAERRTDTQFVRVEKRLAGLEERLAKWLALSGKAIAKSNFYVEQLALFETSEDEKRVLREEAETQARYFLQSRMPRPGEYGEPE